MDINFFLEKEAKLYNKINTLYLQTIKSGNKYTINRAEWWWLFKKKLTFILDNETKSIHIISDKIIKKIELLIIKLNEMYKEIYNAQTELIRHIKEIELDLINAFLEEHTIFAKEKKFLNLDNLSFKYYPEYNDIYFNKKIFEKKEFNDNKITLDDFKKSNTRFKKSPSQKFVSNYISKNTPYNGVLLWHGVGVGKTCAAISIAENFKEFVYKNNKKILILIPSDTFNQTWRDEIFNVKKELDKMYNKKFVGNVQCTGNKYLLELGDFINKDPTNIPRKANFIINKYYKIIGYRSLTNDIEREFKRLTRYMVKNKEKAKINYIKSRFSNRVIIMDEAHVTRKSTIGKKHKIISPYLEMIARYAENTKLILLSATPIYNETKEIVWLMNLLLWNDKVAPMEESQLFNKNNTIKMWEGDDRKIQEGKLPFSLELIKNKTRGYISYLRGENPLIFPYKLYPIRDPNVYTPSPKYIKEKKTWKPISENMLIPNNTIKFYKNTLSLWQYNELNRITSKKHFKLAKQNIYTPSHTSDGFNVITIQASNIIYPSNELDMNSNIIGYVGGENSFKKSFDIIGPNKFKYKPYLDNISGTNKGFLHIDNVGIYSKKIENILKSIITSKGIVLVYSNLSRHGIKPLAIALEENGFDKYIGNGVTKNFLDKKILSKDKFCARNKKYKRDMTTVEEKRTFTQAKYVFLDGAVKKKQLSNLVKEVNGESNNLDGDKNTNDFGEHIMVILGSQVIEQGISFYGVREIHIMDPWWHLNRVEQAAGRGIRSFSHMHLNTELRNVTLYLHVAALPITDKSEHETSDERIYRKAFYKKKEQATLERVLKENAIDCALNKVGNMFIEKFYTGLDDNTLKNTTLINSKGFEITLDLFDKDYDIKCDFNKCQYKCDWENKDPTFTINTDTFNTYFYDYSKDDVYFIKEIIKTAFSYEYVYSIDHLIYIIINTFGINTNEEYVYMALNEIITNKEFVFDNYDRKGYIIYRDKMYIFQPDSINDTNLPIYYRMKKLSDHQFKNNLYDNYPKMIKKIKKSSSDKVTFTKPITKPSISKYSDITILTQMLRSARKYIYKEYVDYTNTIKLAHQYVPNRDDLVKQYQFKILDSLLPIEKIELLSNCLKRIIKNNNKPENDIDQLVLDFYDKKNSDMGYSILRLKRDRYIRLGQEYDSSITDVPIYFRVIYPNKNQEFYEYNDTKELFEKATSLYSTEQEQLKLKNNTFILTDNKSLIYGFLKLIKNVPVFHVVNNSGYKKTKNIDGKVEKKGIRTGAKCGTALEVTKKGQIINTINTVLEHKIHKSLKLPYNKHKSRNRPGRSLCEELELVLRYRQYIRTKSEIDNNIIWFYTMEQIVLN